MYKHIDWSIFRETIIDNSAEHREAIFHVRFDDNDSSKDVGGIIEELKGVTTDHDSKIDKVAGASGIDDIDDI